MKNGFLLRPAEPDERELLEQLQWRASLVWEEYREVLLAHPDAIMLPLEQIEAGRACVAEDADGILGFSVVLPREDGDAELDGLFVEPSAWRKGIGRALVDEALRWAAREGAVALYVIANPRAVGFYVACGFEKIGEIQTRFDVAPVMRRSVNERFR